MSIQISYLSFKLLKEPLALSYDPSRDTLLYKGNYVQCPDIETGITDASDLITDLIPDPPFDVNFENSKDKTLEANKLMLIMHLKLSKDVQLYMI